MGICKNIFKTKATIATIAPTAQKEPTRLKFLAGLIATADNPKNDRFYQGVFLVKRIKHEFDFASKKHTSLMTLVKDSLAKELDGPKDLYEPKPEKNASVFRNKETFYPQI